MASSLSKLSLAATSLSEKMVKAVEKSTVLKDLSLYSIVSMKPSMFFVLICGNRAIDNLGIGAACREDMQIGALHRAISNVKKRETRFTTLGIRGLLGEIEPQGHSWRSIFREIARGAVGKFQPIRATWSPRIDFNNDEFVHCRQETVLGWAMQI